MKTHAIIVYPDGETWNTVDGCTIKVITDNEFQDLVEDRLDAGDVNSVMEIGLTDLSHGE